jgi:streptogramin lyase
VVWSKVRQLAAAASAALLAIAVLPRPAGADTVTSVQRESLSPSVAEGLPTYKGISGPEGIALGADGALWFICAGSDGGPGSIGRITPAGYIRMFSGKNIVDPMGITAGSDGVMWLTSNGTNSISAIGRDT